MSEKTIKNLFSRIIWTILSLVVVIIAVGCGKAKDEANSNNSAEAKVEEKVLATYGGVINTNYFEISLNYASIEYIIETGSEYTAEEAKSGNKFLILDVSFKNIDTESRMIDEGDLLISFNGKDYTFDNTVTIMADGWGAALEQVNPLSTFATNIVYSISEEIEGPAYWEPGRNSNNNKFALGRIVRNIGLYTEYTDPTQEIRGEKVFRNFHKIKIGMTLSEVKKILGEKGELGNSYDYEKGTYLWYAAGIYDSMVYGLVFENGKVSNTEVEAIQF